MLYLKHIGVYFLLLVYSVSFGHQIIPHHHHETSDEHDHHHVGAHDHCVVEQEEHNHVPHEDHFDEGILDYLGCVLGNHEHNSDSECELLELAINQKNNVKTADAKSVFDLALIGFESDMPHGISRKCYHYQFSFNKDLLAQARAMRGPPQA